MKELAAITASAALALALGASPALAQDDECDMTTREVMEEFIPLFFEQRNAAEAFEKWVHPDYINHNPMARTGRNAAVEFLQPFFDANPEARYIVHRVLVDGDLAAVHNEARFNPEGQPSAVVDIFRVEGCKIVEHWDVIQQVPEQSLNDNGMF